MRNVLYNEGRFLASTSKLTEVHIYKNINQLQVMRLPTASH